MNPLEKYLTECSEAIQRGSVGGEAGWGGQTTTAAPRNGQNEPHYHRKGASAVCGGHDGAGGLGFRAKGKLKTEIPG